MITRRATLLAAVCVVVASVAIAHALAERRIRGLERKLAHEEVLSRTYRSLSGIVENQVAIPADFSFDIVCSYKLGDEDHRITLAAIRDSKRQALYRLLFRQRDDGSWTFGMIVEGDASFSLHSFREIRCAELTDDERKVVFGSGGTFGTSQSGYRVLLDGKANVSGRTIEYRLSVEPPADTVMLN